jgi:hypothetical protein
MDPMTFLQPLFGTLLSSLFGGGGGAQAITHPKGQAAQNYQQWQEPESENYSYANPVQNSLAPLFSQQQQQPDPLAMFYQQQYGRRW